MRGLEGKVAVVTGGGGGIGRAICLRLAADGARVGAFDIAADLAEQTVAAVKDAGGEASAKVLDLADYDAVAAAVESFEDEVGPIGILVNNVGWDRAAQFVETEPAFWDQVTAVNMRTHLNACHVVVRRMIAREQMGGKIVNVASDAGRVGSSGEAVYSFCKGGLVAFGKTLAREVARWRIGVNSVCPGLTDTPLLHAIRDQGEKEAKLVDRITAAIPYRRLGRPVDVAGIVAFLASAEADFITGQVISVSGGLTMHG